MATTVVRIRRQNGKVVQNCDVYIGRECTQGGWNLPKSKWANPFPVSVYGREGAIAKYKEFLMSNRRLMADLPSLKGKTLGCWCKPEACHGDVLCELANQCK